MEAVFAEAYERHFQEARQLQAELTHDINMINALAAGTASCQQISTWMRHYGLFQGINNSDRDRIASQFQSFAKHNAHKPLDPDTLQSMFGMLHESLCKTVNRTWLSATSKLLWCLFPHDVVIFDAFVHRTLVVLQALDPGQLSHSRIGNPPSISNRASTADVVGWYMHYQSMVGHLHAQTADIRAWMKRVRPNGYPYDIRITDKVLWIMGNPKWPKGRSRLLS